ncbi:MAG: Rpn family recombination-promoting nuclease/putative transposase [Puniceicoccales bacterium]|jgi:predicted transposase/invertase (TIGR01784 family)|nr:Rpn family recombination-promoting nuclease/putative transposase [Puniceicoccales bacterium]
MIESMGKADRNFFFKLYFLLFSGFVSWGNAAELIHYARATTDTAFKIMMSDVGIAQALVNSLFADISKVAGTEIDPVEIKSVGEVTIPLRGKKANATMDYHGITSKEDHVIVEMQMMHHDNFDKRALFYAASTFVNQEFPRRSKWHLQIKNVYAIQFVDYSTGDKNTEQFRRYYRMTDCISVPNQVIDGICLIQIELAGIQEIADKIIRGEPLTPAEWWYYMIENSESFTQEQINQYKALGMPGKIEGALEKLRFEGWDAKDKDRYEREIQEVHTYNEELDRREKLGKERESIKSLIDGFLDENIPERLLKRIRGQNVQFSRALVREVWDEYAAEDPNGGQNEDTLMPFMGFLRDQGILEPDQEEMREEQSESEEESEPRREIRRKKMPREKEQQRKMKKKTGKR